MTKKDYVAIAACILAAKNNPEHFAVGAWGTEYERGCVGASIALANRLAADNPRFDRARFLAACGVQS